MRSDCPGTAAGLRSSGAGEQVCQRPCRGCARCAGSFAASGPAHALLGPLSMSMLCALLEHSAADVQISAARTMAAAARAVPTAGHQLPACARAPPAEAEHAGSDLRWVSLKALAEWESTQSTFFEHAMSTC